jgi:hypothetical protein
MSRTTRPGQFIQGSLQITRQSNVAAVPYAPANDAQATGSAQPAKDWFPFPTRYILLPIL